MTRFLTIAICLLAVTTFGADAVYVDEQRSNRRQREAARDAEEKLAADGVHRRTDEVARILADRSGVVRDAAVAAIVKQWSDEQLAGLRALVIGRPGKGETDLVGEAAVEIVATRKYAGAGPWLVDVLRDRRVPTLRRRLAAWALREIDARDQVDGVLKAHGKTKDPAVRAEILHTLVALEHADGKKLIDEALDTPRDLASAIVALELMEERLLEATFAPIATWLGDRKLRSPEADPLFFTLLDVLAGVEEPGTRPAEARAVVGGFIDRLDDWTGRLRFDTFQLLERWTRQKDLGHDVQLWQDWWQAQRGEWTPPTGKPKRVRGHTGVAVEYHGIAIDSLAVTFINDISGGMGRNLDGEFDGPGPTRLDLTKKELERVLGLLDKKTLVQLMYFGSYFFEASEQPLPLGRARKKLVAFNRDQKVPEKPGHNRGNVYDTLIAAIHQPIDTVYLLTEGAPTEGKYQNYERFRFHFEQANRFRRVRVHVLSVGAARGRNKDFLDGLATSTGGTFKQIRLK